MSKSRQRSRARSAIGWTSHRATERHLETFTREAPFKLALAYGNSYFLGMSSLGFQRVYALVNRMPDWSCERFFSDGSGAPRSVESDSHLAAFGAIAFSVSFEEDYVNLLKMLLRAGIPVRREQRTAAHPIVIQGGSCAAINPLPMSSFVDVFVLGAAENLLPDLMAALSEEESRDLVCERLAAKEGFFVPAHHRPDRAGFGKLRKKDLSGEQMALAGALPTSAIVTPRTELAEKFLIEMSRGCPEKCKYCWATFGMGRFRWHPTQFILEAMEQARQVTDKLGFVATAVGDHPEIERILQEATRQGFRSAVSSIRIPAVTEGVLESMYLSGSRSITLAPETGSDELRVKLNKPIPNSLLLDKVRMIFRQGLTQLKLYFIIGLPEEADEDVRAILDLVRRCQEIMRQELSPTGVMGQIHLGANILVPKPYTGWQREAMERPETLERRLTILRRGLAGIPNVSMGSVSIRGAIWQSYLTRTDAEAPQILEAAAAGRGTSALLREYSDIIHPQVYGRMDGPLPWHFMRSG